MREAAMTKTDDVTLQRIARVAGCALLLGAAPLWAQDLDPALGVEALAVLEDGRVALRNGETTLDCALIAGEEGVSLGDCRPAAGGVALLSALSDEDWQALVRETLLDERCRLSALGAVADVVAAAAEANGVDPDAIEAARAALAARADAAVDEMLRDGRLTYRGGELALDACP
jgi:hypothetical protein